MCFIDYTKAFDKVQHEEFLEVLGNLNMHGKDIRIVCNLYWEQTACTRIDNDLREYTRKERSATGMRFLA